jgi:hypothetical protein
MNGREKEDKLAGIHRKSHTNQGDLINLLLFLKHKGSRLKSVGNLDIHNQEFCNIFNFKKEKCVIWSFGVYSAR